MVEAVATAVVGIWHMVVGVTGAVFGHLVNLFGGFHIWSAVVEVVYVD